MNRPIEPASIVILGVTGDLTERKLMPALFSVMEDGLLPSVFNIVGYARRDWSNEHLREMMYEAVKTYSRYKPGSSDDTMWDGFASNLSYVQGGFGELDRFKALDSFLKDKAAQRSMPDNRLYYLAAPPNWYSEIVQNIGAAGMAADSEAGWRRIIIEKPFGTDLSSAQALNEVVHGIFQERQVFRIDHYLGKETVQNILVMRFANAIFEPIWNRRYVDHVQISMVETAGVEGRAEFYDSAGVIRDIFQNHLLQVMTLIAMEPPVAFEADAIRNEKVKILQALRPIGVSDVGQCTARGQYTAGTIDGEAVPGFCEVEGIPAGSTTATFAAVRFLIENWRWQGVPFYLRSGKRLPNRVTEVSVHFRSPPHLLFAPQDGEELRPNVLALRIQPDEGISLKFEAKVPGQGEVRRPVTMDFRYRTSFGIAEPPEAYERLLLDALWGDATLFTRSDEIEWAWRHIDPILLGWQDKDQAPPLENYEAGTWGTEGARQMIERDGRQWRRL